MQALSRQEANMLSVNAFTCKEEKLKICVIYHNLLRVEVKTACSSAYVTVNINKALCMSTVIAELYTLWGVVFVAWIVKCNTFCLLKARKFEFNQYFHFFRDFLAINLLATCLLRLAAQQTLVALSTLLYLELLVQFPSYSEREAIFYIKWCLEN
jgi:hypothetical protein